MPNRYQVAFVLSIVGPFFALVALSNYLNAKLAAAGYDISKLILVGLPKKDSPNEYYGMDFHAVELPYFGTQDLVALASTPAFIVSTGLILVGVLWTTVINSGPRKILNPKIWLEFPLEKKIQISPNTAIYRFSLPARVTISDITRSYTPISSDDQKGSFDLLIKSYEKGNISRHFSLLKLGNNIRIINAVLKNPADRTALSLIYANVNEEDILMKTEIDALARAHGDRFKVYYVLNNPPTGWTGGVGFVSKDQIHTHLPASTGDAKILMCGPPPMLTAMKKHLDELQWPAPRTVSKLADKVFLF
ncbi:NADH-cytochrome b5 reductase [Mycena galopus ATCC 62051]|nr:NADH-cytochrome b5 reductase [Mycena galopus ATCC 62051]